MAAFDREAATRLVAMALAEDLGAGDVTTACLARRDAPCRGIVRCKEDGVLAGAPVVDLVFEAIDRAATLAWAATDGDSIREGQEILVVEGRASTLLAAERTSLNFLQRLAGIATTTREFVRRIEGTGAAVLDTRKTTPGWRSLEKYAVAVGGGTNHRTGLFDQALFKENHLSLARAEGEPLEEIVRRARDATAAPVQVEVRNLEELREGLAAGAELLMLDNMGLDEMREAVALVRDHSADPRPALEASGGITLETIRAVAETGVDRISVGALTHSPRALDIAMYIE